MSAAAQLQGRVAIVTGGARGIGRHIVEAFAREGADVAVADLDLGAAEEAAASVRAMGRRALGVRVDVSNVADARRLIEETTAALGRLDVLVNNAGICPLATIEEVTEELFDRIIAVDLKGVFFISQAAIPVFKRQGSGKIVNIGSIGGRTGGAMPVSVYSAAKAGVLCLTKSFAHYLAPHGVTVNAIAPGPTETELTRDWPGERVKGLQGAIPLRRFGRPEEIAAVALFLASDASSYMTGATVDVNGGLRMD